MDIKQLVTFITFVNEKSYNRAAQKLNYGVSTLVAHVTSLENEFHVELIHSQGRKSTLTDAGKAFLPYAQKMLSVYQDAYVAMTSLEGISGHLNLAVSETVGLHRLSSVYSEFTKQYPNVQLTVHISSPQHFIRQLNSGAADVAFSLDFSPTEDESMISVPLYEEPLVLVAPPKHPLAKATALYGADLKYQELVFPRREYIEHPTLKQVLLESQITVNENLFLDSGILLKQMILDRKCLSFMPLSSVQEDLSEGDLVALPWRGEPISMMVYALYKKNSLSLSAIEALIAFVQTQL